ncbi:MAG: Cof-type HAD-IIB family hydrolase [Lachnospiraceae bacterium]
MIKAIFFDIDGTLLSHQTNMIPESAVKSLLELKKKGIKTFIATGRHPSELHVIPIRELGFEGVVGLNGQLCMDAEGRMIYDAPLAEEDVAQAAEIFEQKQIPMFMIEKKRMYVNFIDEKVRRIQETFLLPQPKVDEYRGGKVYQLIVYAAEEEEDAVMQHLPNCKKTRWHKEGIDILSKDGGKEIGISKTLEYYGIDRHETMAFGDGDNDTDMLRFAGIGIAMGNAAENVKQCADYVTTDIDDDGIRNALLHFGILE